MTGNPIWKKIPLGTRVRHCTKRYEGWIDGGWTSDGTQCQVYIHSSGEKVLSAQNDLEVCNDIAEVMDVSTLDQTLTVFIGPGQFSQVPIFCQIWTLGWYHARPLLRRTSFRNLDHTQRINSLKQAFETERLLGGLDDSYVDDVEHFYNRLNPLLKIGFPIAIVPTHDPAAPNLVRRLSAQRRIDATSCLVRIRNIGQQHQFTGKERMRIKRHLDNIEVRNESLIQSKVVLLLDDIVTTGTSLMACKKLLLDAGASEVICLALGRATL
jgi:hypothetical protein